MGPFEQQVEAAYSGSSDINEKLISTQKPPFRVQDIHTRRTGTLVRRAGMDDTRYGESATVEWDDGKKYDIVVDDLRIIESLSEEYENRGWLGTLDDARLKKALKALGEIHKKYEYHDTQARKLQPRYGEIAAGGGHFEQFLKSEVYREFYSAISKGEDPDAAKRTTEQLRTRAVKKWNARRGRDYQTHRADTAEQHIIDMIWRKFKQL